MKRAMLAVVALLGFLVVARPAIAQDVTGADLAVVTLTSDDLPGYKQLTDAVPDPVPGATRDQLTRLFSTSAPDGKLVLLTILLSAPRATNPCLALIAPAIAGGLVFSDLNGDQPNFALLGSIGAGDADSTATWADLDTGSNAWTSLYAAAFLRGQVSVYLFYRSYGALPDFSIFSALVLAQDAKLKQAAAAAPASPLGLLLTTPVPAPDTAPGDCYR